MKKRERERDFRFCILVTGWYLKKSERETFGCVYWLPDDIWEREIERLSVLYTGYQVMFEKKRQRDFRFCILTTRWWLRKRERETFGFVYWLPGDAWERETETFGFVYWLPDDIWERERDFRFCILVTRWYLRKRERERLRFCMLVTR